MTKSPTITAAHTAPIARNEEVVLSREIETPISQVENNESQERDYSHTRVADTLLADSKRIGLAETFQKLASGAYRAEIDVPADFDIDQDAQEIDDVISLEAYNAQKFEENAFDEHPDFDETDEKIVDSDQARKSEIVSYIAEQVHADPLMKQKLGEVASEMIARGEAIDPDILQEEALSRYITEKESGEPLTLEEKVVSIEEQFAELLNENDELKKELTEFKALVKQQSETMHTMALALLEMAKKLHKEKEEEEEQMSLLELLIKLMGMFLQEMAKVDEDAQRSQNQTQSEKKAPPVIQIPRIKIKTDSPQKIPKAA